jgi:hypothetical protein
MKKKGVLKLRTPSPPRNPPSFPVAAVNPWFIESRNCNSVTPTQGEGQDTLKTKCELQKNHDYNQPPQKFY